MKVSKKRLPCKLTAVIFAFVAAIGILFGGVYSVTAHAEEHTHTFSEEWRSGYKNHWREATCGHDIVSEMSPHTFTDGKCTVCGEEKIDVPHVHTFKDAWKYDETNHWHESSCGHNIVKNIAPHDLSGGTCVCGYKAGGSTEPDPGPGIDPGPGVDPNPGEEEEPKEPAVVPDELNAADGYNESMYAEWTADNVNGVKAYYKEDNDAAAVWTQIDERLVRMTGGRTARVDAVGLKAGKYCLKIVDANNKESVASNITVTSYDRSGYAHFNRKAGDPSAEGVGAYKDDGTLKDGALVIYVNDSNKNDIRGYTYKDGKPEDISEYFWTDLNNEKQYGIGYLLNNRQYRNNTEREQFGIQALSFKYGAVAVRFLGKVVAEDAEVSSNPKDTLVLGLTAYDSTAFGGTVGDNGRMARITNAKNLTLEGIGEDAEIWGWGFHFVSNDNLHKYAGSGKSFEARNLTFSSYPEDALGMEGTQGVADSTGSITSGASSASSKLCSPVERCWVHNNVFNPGGCENAAESDKKEGDGSCDIKRGQYFTVSYNYYTNCHKTNLVGSSDNSLTYNYSMHHNWWYNCWSREPLVRRANIHYYNNYIEQDVTADPQPKIGYVSSVRANAYMFSEANYFEGAKNVAEVASGGVIKAYGNVHYASYGNNSATQVSSRDAYVSNSCKYIGEGIDYSRFDTNPEQFYVGNYFVQDAVSARKTVMGKAGVNGFGRTEFNMNKYTPDSAVQLAEEGETNITIGTNVSGVLFNGVSKAGKFKGQGITFTLASEAQLTVTSGTAGDTAPELVRADGTVIASKFNGTIKVVLEAGTYFIASGMKDKEALISSMSFADTGNSSAARVEAAKTAINALPGTVTAEHKDLVTAAQTAYSALTDNEKTAFDSALKTKLDNAVTALNRALADEVAALINAIGTVTADSYEKINAAQTAYNKLTAVQKALVSNYNVLVAAEEAFSEFAVDNLAKRIEALPDVSTISITDEEAVTSAVEKYNNAYATYLDFGDIQKANMDSKYADSVKKLTDGLEALKPLPNLFSFRHALEEIEDPAKVTLSEGNALIALYKQLTSAQKAALTDAENTKYAKIQETVTELANSVELLCFTSGKDGYNNSFFTYSGKTMTGSCTADGVTYTTGLKMESSTTIKFTTSTDRTLTLYFSTPGQKVKVDGTSYTIGSDGKVTVSLSAGAHSITKDSTSTYLFLVSLSPAA